MKVVSRDKFGLSFVFQITFRLPDKGMRGRALLAVFILANDGFQDCKTFPIAGCCGSCSIQ